MKPHLIFTSLLPLLVTASMVHAEERTMTPEQMEALEKNGDFTEEAEPRPGNLPDLTKGEEPPETENKPWTLGPTGIIGMWIGDFKGDQFQVLGALKGSPSEGKVQWGDVITGVGGKKFVTGGHMGIEVGNAIVEAEKEQNAGRITFQVWRDKNYGARRGKQDVTSVDIDDIFDKARDDNSLYEWKPEEDRAKEVTKMGFDEFPADVVTLDVELKLRIFPDYSDTAPYDCPKTAKILEDAWKVLEQKFVPDPKNPRSGRGGIIEAIALVASGKPEHREIVREWVRRPKNPWGPPTTPAGTMFEPGYKGYKGMQTWHHGYNGLNCALYYEATGDDYVLPALRKAAIDAAMGQSALGSWGHTFAYPSFNGGEFHKMNPGYGALNAAGNRCFFLITLAQKLGVEHPEIDLAVKRAQGFFGSYIDQGCIPYGDHGAYGSDDSNGKNTGVAFSLKLLGDKHGAKYFSMMSSHCAFTRRGGHAADYHGNWSSWAATICGPQVRTYNERNLRWRRTLCRMYDGSFVYHSPTGKYGTLRDPTATEVLHQSVIFKQTLITGKDPDEELYPTEREMKQLLASAQPQISDPWLKELAGTPWPERTTDEIFELLDIFYPKARSVIARKLGERFQAGEADILPRLLALLESDEPRYRDGALQALGACGEDVVLSNLSKLTPLIQDPEDFVRINAIKVISKYTASEETQLAMLKATIDEPKAIAPNSVRNTVQSALFSKDNPLANNPFESGFDQETVWQALEELILIDPAGKTFMSSRNKAWTQDTVVRLAGPLTYAAEEEQVGDQMFANRSKPAQELLGKFGYAEGVHATAHRLRKQAAIRRDIRPFVGFKRSLMDPELVEKQPDAFLEFVDEMEIVLIDDPLTQLVKLVNDKKVDVPLERMYNIVKAQSKAATMPSIADDVRKSFQAELDKADGTGAKIKLCRDALKSPENRDYFRKIAAMESLAEMLGPDALEDLLPYMGDRYWRLREHCQKIAAELVTSGGADVLASHFTKTTSPETAVGILEVFARSGAGAGLAVAKDATKHGAPSVRMAAVKAYSALGGEKVLPGILDHLKNASAKEDLRGCEEALLSYREDPARIAKIRDAIIALLPGTEMEVRKSIYYLLSQIADTESIAALRKASEADDMGEFDEVIFALSYSPSREADKVMLDLAATDKRIAQAVGSHSVRRMVLGPKGFGDITVDQKMDFAEAMLKMALDRKLIQYLGGVHEARAIRALMFCLEKGVESAADSLVACAEGMGKLSAEDTEIAVQSLQDVIEYIEVTRLRGGIKAHMDKDDKYIIWKALQARAGKVLLKIHKPGEVPIPEFDPLEFE
jgi:HEAT repeat protein